MNDVNTGIAEIDILLSDLRQRLTDETLLKNELDEYIAKEIETKSSNKIESIRLQYRELQVLISKHKQHLWNHIQAIKHIRLSIISLQETLSDTKTGLQQELEDKFIELSNTLVTHKAKTESSINTVKTEIITKLSECYTELSDKDKAFDEQLADLINVVTTEHFSINANLATLNNSKEIVDFEIPKLHELNDNLGKDIAKVSESIFSADGHIESRLSIFTNEIVTHKSNTESSINTVKTEITTKLSEYYAELSEKNKALDKELADLINVVTTGHSSIKDNLETLNNCKEFVDSEIPKLHELSDNMGNVIAQVSKSIFDADGHLESRLRETIEHSVDKEGFYKFVEKVEEDQRLKDRLIKNLRKVSIAQSILLVLTISFILIRLLLY